MCSVTVKNYCIEPDEENDASLSDWFKVYGYLIETEPRFLKGLVPKDVYKKALKSWGKTGKYRTFSEYRAALRAELAPVKKDVEPTSLNVISYKEQDSESESRWAA